MTQKCVHKGCGKPFTDPNEPCIYHPGPPEFHEGQKGWKCCKPRVLTFDEFLAIPPCTTGTHSTVDDTPAPVPVPPVAPAPRRTPADDAPLPRNPLPASRALDADVPRTGTPQPDPETEDDEPSVPIPAKAICRRRGCGAAASERACGGQREGEECRHHPGAPIFHEGSKGWSCCKRRVLEFEEFVKIEGCTVKDRHLFVGSGKEKKKVGEEELDAGSVRSDFYQSAGALTLSFYLKKVLKPPESTVEFEKDAMKLDLKTEDGKRYRERVALYAEVVPEECQVSVRPSKVEMVLKKRAPAAWPGLRQGDESKGEIYQVGKAGRA